MRVYIFPILFTSVLLILIFRVFMKKNSNGFDEAVEEFKRKEQEANHTIKDFKDLNIKYIYPNKDILPFKEYTKDDKEFEELAKKQSIALRKCDLKMARLPLYLTNTELKSTYGINNFDKITILEEHYNSCIRAFFEWAKVLKEFNFLEDCKIVLEECVRLEGDITHIYTILSDLYFEEKSKSSILELKNLVNKYELSSKDKILQYLEEKIRLL